MIDLRLEKYNLDLIIEIKYEGIGEKMQELDKRLY